jgi:beta-N-acetylhexosaminidase
MQLSRLLMMDLSQPELTADEKAFLKDHPIGGVCLFGRNIRTKEQVADFVASIREIAGQEVLIGIDQEGGSVLRMYDIPYCPSGMSLGAADDVALTEKVASIAARGLASAGINVNFAPVADVNNNPMNPIVVDRAFSADPVHASRHVAAYVKGMQAANVAATIKHFPGHGDVSTDSHEDLPKLNFGRERFEEIEMPPFKAGFAAGADCVMTFHGIVGCLDPENPATLSRKVITDFLRGELGYDGVVFTDALDMGAIAKYNTPAQSATRAVIAGVDQPLHIGPLADHIAIIKAYEDALKDGRLDPKEVEDKLRRISRLAAKYTPKPNPAGAWQAGDEELLREAAIRGMAMIGDFKLIEKSQKVVIVAPTKFHVSIASMLSTKPQELLAAELTARGYQVETAFYDPEQIDEAMVLAKIDAADVALFNTVNSLRLNAAEKALAAKVVGSGKARHIGVWNPYHAMDLQCPTLLTFNPEDRAIKAVAEVMTQGPLPTGKVPVKLS